MITGTDLIAPVGALTTTLLAELEPGIDPLLTAASYAAAGGAVTLTWASDADAGAKAWATYRALSDRAQQILASATTVRADGEGSVGFSAQQAKHLLEEAALYRDMFLVLEAGLTIVVGQPSSVPATQTVRTRVVF